MKETENKWEQTKPLMKRASQFKVRNSYGAEDFYRDFRKTCPRGKKISYQEYVSIIKLMNSKIVDELVETGDVVFPQDMGGLYIKIAERKLRLENGRVKGLAVDWASTVSLWLSDPEAREAKTIVRREERTLARVLFRRTRALFQYKTIFSFDIYRRTKVRIYDRIHEGHKYIFK